MTSTTEPAPAVTPYPIPSMAPRMVQLANIVVGRHRTLPFKSPAGNYELSFLASLPGYRPVAGVTLRLGDQHRVHAGIDLFPPGPLLGEPFSKAAMENLPPDVQRALFEAGLEEALNQLSEAVRVPVAVEELNPADSAEPPATAIFFELKDGAGKKLLGGHLPGDVATWEWVAGLLSRQPAGRGRECAEVPVPFLVELGRTLLPAREFAGLEANDVVLLDECLDPPRRSWIVLASTVRFEAEFSGQTATIQKMATDTPANPPASSTPAAPAQQATSPGGEPRLEALPVQLVFEAGQRQISFGELKSLKPGFTFEVDLPPGRPLTIRANGQAIGSGELVQIGDRVGVRIIELTI